MGLRHRVVRLQRRMPTPRPSGLPTDPGAILAGFPAGRFTLADMGDSDPEQGSALGRPAAVLIIRAAEVDPHSPHAAVASAEQEPGTPV